MASSLWQNSLMSCCSPFDLCCEATWCPCIVFGRTTHRLRHNGNMQGYSCCNTDCTLLCCLTAAGGFGGYMQCMRRADIRTKYNIEGDCCSDCLASMCCHCCAIIQQEKEVIARTSGVNQEGYRPQPGMQMQM